MIPRKFFVVVGGLFFTTTFLFFYLGISQILNRELTIQNYIAYFVFSFLIGIITGAMTYLKFNVGLPIFTLSYLIGFGMMLYSFTQPLSGWSNEIGLVQMLMFLAIGIILALVIEFVLYIRRSKKPKQ